MLGFLISDLFAGNKVWYTTMGAKDIIGQAISASAGSLPSKIKASQTSSSGLQKDIPEQSVDPRNLTECQGMADAMWQGKRSC